MFNKEIYIERRNNLKKSTKTGLIIIPGNGDSPISYKDNCYNFIQDSSFLYFFGLNSQDLIGVIDVDNNQEYIFGKEYTIDDIIWMGNQELFKNQALQVGIDNFKEIEELNSLISNSKNINQKILFTKQYRDANILKLSSLLDINPFNFNEHVSEELEKNISNLRNIKSKEEIIEIEKAVNITRDMHLEAMRNIKAGMKEFELAAIIEKIAKSFNATTSFQTICTVNGEILHNHSQNNTLKDGDLILLDCGARTNSGYCGDMTTVFPVSGKFSEVQKTFYSILIKMFEKAESLIKPGISYKEVHLSVCRVLIQEMINLNILKGDIEEILDSGAHALFFPHGLGHMLGMDVHDMENLGENIIGYEDGIVRSSQFGLKSLRLARTLQEGFVITVEPGIYFIPELIKKWKNQNNFSQYINYDEIDKYISIGGMRYEGDYLITADGSRRLGDKMPKYFYEIENILSK